MRNRLVLTSLLLCMMVPAVAQLSVAIRSPNVSIGINLPLYPELVPVPGYPVYYAPDVDSNYFFYDGLYWVYQDDGWYASSWYDGPWALVEPEFVPLFVLRVPVQYYRRPPVYFRSWQPNEPPRWGDHWGNEWSRRHTGWDHWDRHSVPAPAPLPVYQRQYSGDRYPKAERQSALRNQNYRYQPHDPAARQVQTQRDKSVATARPEPPRTQQQPREVAPNNAGSNKQPNTPLVPRQRPSEPVRDNARKPTQPPTPDVEPPSKRPEQRQEQRPEQRQEQKVGPPQQHEPKSTGQEARPGNQAAPREQERAQKPNKKDNRDNADDRDVKK
jgi:hypothetical protein